MKSSGEVAAIFGYNKQYNVFAVEIYDSLLNNDLEWVELASNDAGKLDDVLIGSKKEVKAYQVKDITGNLTYQKFTDSDTESIFKGCYKGWLYLKEKYPEKKILAKYISNELPSSSDKISKFIGTKTPSFKEFIQLFWNRIKIENLEVDEISSQWKEVFNELKMKTNSSDANLIEFIKSFDFVLNNDYKVYENMLGNNNSQRYRDIEKISKHIFKVIGTQGTTRYERVEFLKEFGLLSRYETHFKHSFFVDEEHYQPITDTIQKLEFVINNTLKGYIAVIGNAGSGKSTLLTKWLKDRKEKVLRYYAYINKEMNGEYGYRGEAEIFLKDLLIQIREHQYSSVENLPSETLPELQKQLSYELEKFKNEGRKVFIIVDGLDHIEREQNVNKSLIDILPIPNQIPDNVYFILGTRTTRNLANLPERIKISLEDEGRTIIINPLSPSQIQKLLKSHKIYLNNSQLANLNTNTLGHPLFLRYTIEELQNVSKESYDSLIDNKSFKGDIYEEYKIFWNKNKLEDNFINILGIISRFRYSYIDINLLPKFVSSRADWNKVEKLSEHFFYKKNNIWQFFHNSFKEFLKDETAKNYITNQYDEKIDTGFHLRIYDVIANSNADYKWNVLFHLYHGKNYDELLSIATQDFFREQWFDFRNHRNIYDDIKIASDTSYIQNSSKKLFEYILAHSELTQRINNFYPSDYFRTFHQLNKIDIANSFIFDNTELLVSNSKVLEYALEIYKKGNHALAFDLLKKAEPVYLLNITKEVSPNRYDRDELAEVDEVELIKNWAILSSLFYPTKKIFEKVSTIKIIVDERRGNTERNILQEISDEITDFLVELEDWEKLNNLYSFINKNPEINIFHFCFETVWQLDNNNDLYGLCLNDLRKWSYDEDVNPINRRLALVEIFINKNLEEGKKRFDKLKHPKEIKINDNYLYGTLDYVYDYSRLFYIISKEFDVDSSLLVPNLNKEILLGFYSEFAELGKSSAYIYCGNSDASTGFIFRFKQILGYFNYSHLDYDYDYSIQQNKAELINLVLLVSSRISTDFFNQILNEISIAWQKNLKHWSRKDKQEVIEFVIDSKINIDWCSKELNILNKELFEYGDTYSRIENGVKQIELLSLLNKIDEGEEILNKLMEISFDINHEKDSQLDDIINWFEKKENIDSKEIEFYINCLDSINQKTSRASENIAKKLLNLALPRGNGFEIFKYLLFEGQVNFNDSLEILLIHFLNVFPEHSTLFSKMFTRIILNFDNDYSYRTSFIEELFNRNLSQLELNFLVNEIAIHSVFEHRQSYYSLIKKYTEKNHLEFVMQITSTNDNNRNDDYSHLKLKGEVTINKKDVLERINSYNDIIELLEQEDRNSYFKWSTPVVKIIDKLKSNEIRKIKEKKNFDSIELVKIAKAYDESRNDVEFTKELLDEAIKKSSSSGWFKYYDGGSKLETYKLLKTIDNNTSKLVFKDFVSNIDIVDSKLINVVHEILALIDDDFSFSSYYDILESYKNELLKTHYNESTTPNIDGNLSNEDFFYETIKFLIGFPTNFDDVIFEIFIEELDKNKKIIEKILNHLYHEKYDYQFIKLLSAISLKDLKFVKSYETNVIEFLNHSRFDIHRIAVRILERLQINYKKLFNRKTTQIPLAYKLEFEYKPELVVSEKEKIKRLNKTGYLRETNDPIEYCNLYKLEIKTLSKGTGFQIINLATRIVDLGDKFLNQPDWYKNLSEKEIRDIYKHRFDLKVSYRRPRYQKVWAGLMIVVKELWELNLIDRSHANFLSNQFDENLYFVKPEMKPSFISSIIKEDNYVPFANEKWVSELSLKYLSDNLKLTDNEFYVIAEHSLIEGQGDGHTQETRQSFVDFERVDFNDDFIIFEKVYNQLISDYANIEIDGLCFYNFQLTVDKKVNWLAFNPEIAVLMGLELSRDGIFRWVDKENTIVIESVFWQNNDETNKSRNLHSECGHGWYVRITKAGIEKLKELELYPQYHHQKISRNLTFIQNRYNTYIENKNDIDNIVEIDLLEL
ncbi:hypothetical protein [Flavobacterium sp. FlaQc-30]|uniref:hypothetical protein n=1 Tax=Flavobacterium sp. FlaQc-30 TaxID=3374179 RepID=UPI0037580DB6